MTVDALRRFLADHDGTLRVVLDGRELELRMVLARDGKLELTSLAPGERRIAGRYEKGVNA